MIIPSQLARNYATVPERRAWLEQLPALLAELSDRWELSVEPPFDQSATASWVAPAKRRDGTSAVLKLGMPHMEGEGEIAGLRAWRGDPTVELLEADDERNAMLLERCEPGTPLRALAENEQDIWIATLLKRLWMCPRSAGFRPLSAMLACWTKEALEQSADWQDRGLMQQALEIMAKGSIPCDSDCLLATDLHAGNVLRAQREPWLVIDPKPFLGDRAYDPVQHLFNCKQRLERDPRGMVRRLADLTEVDESRLQLWTFARAALESRGAWGKDLGSALARKLAP